MADEKLRRKKRNCDSADLTRRAASGDRDVLAELVECFERRLYDFARRYCGDEEDARDALQDAYETAARHIGGFRGEASIKTWVTRLVISACSRRHRGARNDPKRHVYLDQVSNGQLTHALHPSHAPEESIATQEMMDRLERELLKMGEMDRAVLLLRDGQELSTAETAEFLGLTIPAVKSRLHRARKRVRKALGSMEG